MIEKDLAVKLTKQYINEHYGSEEELDIEVEGTIEKGYGWIFFYNTKKYLETKKISYALAGNGPIMVEKSDGKITAFGTDKSIEDIIKDYEHARES